MHPFAPRAMSATNAVRQTFNPIAASSIRIIAYLLSPHCRIEPENRPRAIDIGHPRPPALNQLPFQSGTLAKRSLSLISRGAVRGELRTWRDEECGVLHTRRVSRLCT